MPEAKELKAARPEDLVLISFSTNGETREKGQFYLLPSDSSKPISSEDLAEWLGDVDTGEMVLILDVCYSARAVAEDFKPAPLGDPGLGQLA